MSIGLTEKFSKFASGKVFEMPVETPDLLTSLFNRIAPVQHVTLEAKPEQPDIFAGQNPKDVAALQRTLSAPGIKAVSAPDADKVAKGIDQTRNNVRQNVDTAKEAKADALQLAQKMDRKNETATPSASGDAGTSPARAVVASLIPDPVSAGLTLVAGAVGGPAAAAACAALTTGVQATCAAMSGGGTLATFDKPSTSTPRYGSKADMKRMSAGYGISESAPSPQPYGQQTFAQPQNKPAAAETGKPAINSGQVQTAGDGLGGITKCVLSSPQMACLENNIEHYEDIQKQLAKREQDGVALTKDNINTLATMGADQQIMNVKNNNSSRLTGSFV